MVQNREVSVNWLRINVPQIAAILGVGMGLAWYSGDKLATLDNRITTIEQSRQARSVVADKVFDQIQDKLKPLDNVTYRLDQADRRDDAQDVRIDKLLEIMATKIDSVVDRVNVLSTKVEVLSEKIDTITPPKKAEIGVTPPELVR